jgi:hypothetical protein
VSAEEPGGVTERDRAKDDGDHRPHLVRGVGPGPSAQQDDHDDADPGAEREPGDEVGQQQTRWPALLQAWRRPPLHSSGV